MTGYSDMEDKTPLIGFGGTLVSFTISQWSDIFGLAGGILTCVYLLAKLYKLAREKTKY